jgi:tetratricopeptide (TPR) repeat protein
MSQSADFFVSYTSADRAWAEWIAWQLEAEGYRVALQAWDFRPGSDFVQQMDQMVQEAERIITVLSPAYVKSAFAGAEWRAAFAEDPSGKRGLLLPVRVEEVDPRGLLKTRTYLDLVGQDSASAREMLLAAARGARGKPIHEREFPGAPTRPVDNRAEVPRFPGTLPLVWNVPYHPNPYFTGRDLLLAALHTGLTAPDQPTRRIALTGLGGVGKSQSVVEYAYRQQADYGLVWWVRADQPTSLLGDYATLADQPPLAADLGFGQDVRQETAIPAVRDWLEHHQDWLLILDNADDPQTVADLLPRSSAGHLLITSRTGVGWERLATPLPVEVLAPDDAADLLLARTGETGPEAEAAAARLASTLGGLPLALEQAGAFIATTGTVSLAGYADLFDTRASELLKRGQPLGYQHTVATSWSLALQRLREAEPAAVGLLILAAFLAPNDLPQPLLTTRHEELPEPLASAAGDPLALGDAVAALRRYSLVRVIGDGVFVHRLVQTVVRVSLGPDIEATWAAAAVRLLRTSFPYRSDEVGNWVECERLLPHVLAVAEHAQRLKVEPKARLWLLRQAGLYLWSRGRRQQAVVLDEQVVTTSRLLLGDDHSDTLTAMNNQANGRWAVGDWRGARDLHEQILAARRRVFGDVHDQTLMSLINLAAIDRDLGNLQSAQDLHQQALAISRQVLVDGHWVTMTVINNLALTHRALGDLQGAYDLHEQALAGRRRVLGDDHPDSLRSMNNLAETLADLGDLDGARELHQQALAGFRQVLGDDHPDTLLSVNHLAELRREVEEQ